MPCTKMVVTPASPSLPGYCVLPRLTGFQFTWVIPKWFLPIWVNRGKPHQGVGGK